MMGRIWKFGDDIDTDVLAPGQYMSQPIETLAAHCLEAVDPTFAGGVRSGDILVAGRSFGIGSSREQAAQALKVLGIQAVVAQSFAGIFYRNAINLGLLVLVGDASVAQPGDRAEIDIATGKLRLPERDITLTCDPLPEFLLDLIRTGGLVPHLKKRFGRVA